MIHHKVQRWSRYAGPVLCPRHCSRQRNDSLDTPHCEPGRVTARGDVYRIVCILIRGSDTGLVF